MNFKQPFCASNYKQLNQFLRFNIFIFLGWVLIGLNLSFSQISVQGNGVYDTESNYYSTIILNNGQEWMAENLRSKKFSNGDSIPLLNLSSNWQSTSTAAVGDFNNSSISSQYGNIYNWFATIDERNVCPSGWHVPTDIEWTSFSDALGGNGVAGGKMKLEDTLFWKAPNLGATNESLFSAMPAGCRYDGGNYANIYSYAYWWSATQLDNQFSWYRSAFYNSDNLVKNFATKRTGYSIRCVKNQAVEINNINTNSKLLIYPNPFEETVVISGEIVNQQLLIFDINGRLVKSQQAISNSEIISLVDCEKGIYYLKVPPLGLNYKLIKQ